MEVLYTIQDLFRKTQINREFKDLTEYWQTRITKVCQAPINKSIEHCANAGAIVDNYQLMHNGLKVYMGSYYGYGESFDATHIMLEMNKGVHEPEEEYYFGNILREMRPGAVMIELGAYWSYYSMWFNKTVSNAINYMIEPEARSLYSGRKNFKLNGLRGLFYQYFISSHDSLATRPVTLSIDSFVKLKKIEHIDILHCDIQGFEFDMLLGAKNILANKTVEYIFISTHSNELHFKCLEYLKNYDYIVLVEIDLDRISSFDGLIIVKACA